MDTSTVLSSSHQTQWVEVECCVSRQRMTFSPLPYSPFSVHHIDME